jgi:hypothetical protein
LCVKDILGRDFEFIGILFERDSGDLRGRYAKGEILKIGRSA